MVRTYIGAHSAKIVLAFLLFGSISGFVLGQELHHPLVPTTHTTSLVRASAAGSLGTAHPTTPSVVKTVSQTHPSASHQSTPAHHARHKHHHGDNEDAISVSMTSVGSVSVQQSQGGSGDGSGHNGGHSSSGGD